MLIISDQAALSRALDYPLDPALRDHLLLRVQQLGGDLAGVRFVIIQPGDRPRWVEEALGWSIFQDPATGSLYGDPDYSFGLDLCLEQDCAYELTFERTTDHTDVVLVQKGPGVHRDFIRFCAEFASQHA